MLRNTKLRAEVHDLRLSVLAEVSTPARMTVRLGPTARIQQAPERSRFGMERDLLRQD